MIYPDIRRLEKAGYMVAKRSPWHFQAMNDSRIVNIWPTKRKYMIDRGNGASYYTDILKAVESLIGKPGQKHNPRSLLKQWQDESEAKRTPEMREAEIAWRKGLDKVYAKLNNN